MFIGHAKVHLTRDRFNAARSGTPAAKVQLQGFPSIDPQFLTEDFPTVIIQQNQQKCPRFGSDLIHQKIAVPVLGNVWD